ncbi:patatin-like protein [Tanacetum coccineum]
MEPIRITPKLLIFWECKGGNAHVIDVAGTSTGGLMIAMLAVPDENHRPMYSAEDIKEFYFYHAPKIFPQIRLALAIMESAYINVAISLIKKKNRELKSKDEAVGHKEKEIAKKEHTLGHELEPEAVKFQAVNHYYVSLVEANNG